MPVQYIIGKWQFRTANLIMKPPVFIPRPETEDLTGLIIDSLHQPHRTSTFMDMCCGSGAISVSLLKENRMLKGYAMDILPEAIELTKENSIRNEVSDRLSLLQSSVKDILMSQCLEFPGFDFIVSNPPYVLSEEIPTLQPEITRYEAHCALDGGADGLDVIKEVLTASTQLLNSQGFLWLETGLEQDIKSLLERYPKLSYLKQFPDYTGRYRFHLLQRNKTNS